MFITLLITFPIVVIRLRRAFDLVMLTNGWRRFKWNDVVKGLLPKIIFPKDTAYLSLSGKSLRRDGCTIKGASGYHYDHQPKKCERADPWPCPSTPTAHLMNLRWCYLILRIYIIAFQKDLKEHLSVLWNPSCHHCDLIRQQGIDSLIRVIRPGNARHFQLSDESIQLMKLYEGKVLENVIVKARRKSPMQVLDEKYSTGLFSGGDAYQFDLLTDPFAATSMNIFTLYTGQGRRVAGQYNGQSAFVDLARRYVRNYS